MSMAGSSPMSEKLRGKVLKCVFVAGFSANGEPKRATFSMAGGGSSEDEEDAVGNVGIGGREFSGTDVLSLGPEKIDSRREAAVISPRLKPRLRTRRWLTSMG
jgi:hypothetical protein